jgi:hypothetical protein
MTTSQLQSHLANIRKRLSERAGPRRRSVLLAAAELALGLPVLLLLLCASEREARAYTDPGSGALIWQMLMAAFVGGAFYFRRFTAWVRRRLESNADQSVQQQDSSATRKDEFIP